MTEFDCADCGQHVIGFAYSPSWEPVRCLSCDWITRNLAPVHHAAARKKLGVPLKKKRRRAREES